MRFYAKHGVHAHERELGRTVRVDVSLALDASRAGRSDDLADTINFDEIYRLVRGAVAGKTRNLGERVAEDIAQALLSGTSALAVRVRFAKPNPPIEGGTLEEEVVEIERRR